ncbi:MAG TPA: hypothetical protein VF721_08830 [Pyrinomonadaceae bacterium]|jgi:hypothetical protein
MKRSIYLFLFLLFAALLLTSAAGVSACSCVPSAPCQSFGRADVVFVGKVVGAKFQKQVPDYEQDNENANTATPTASKKITYDVGEIYFEVGEAFAGTEKGSRITIHSGTGGGDCGFWFRRGETYLVFASRENSKADSGISSMTGGSSQNLQPNAERLWTTICAGTREIKTAEASLKYLRDLPKPGAGGTIVGRIDESIRDYSDENLSAKPMPGTKVKAEQIKGEKQIFYGTTDRNGYFEIKVPVGEYLVTPVLPPNLDFSNRYEGENEPLKIEDRKCESKIFQVTNDSDISGKVLGANGKPYPSLVLDLIPAGKTRKDEGFDYKFGIVGENGNFSFRGIPPGRYILSLNYTDKPEDDSPFPTTFYPQTGVRTEAKVFEIDYGTKFGDIVFRLPPPLLKRRVSGTVVWKNGKPAVGAEVQFVDVEFEEGVFFNEPVTNAGGEFAFDWFEGRKYQIRVIVWKKSPDGQSGTGIGDGESKVFTLNDKTPKFRIVLNTINPNEKIITRKTVRAN